MKIRLAETYDIDGTAELISRFRVELKALKGIKSSYNIEGAKEEFNDFIEAKFPIFIAEEDDGRITGYLVCRIDGGTVWVESLYVDPKERRRGIATELYKEAEILSRELGNDTLFNYVHPNNDKIIRFLSKMGYDVLNLIEIRRPWKGEKPAGTITVGDYKYRY